MSGLEAAENNHAEKLVRPRAVLARARAELGDDLEGGSVVDLLADNFPWSLAQCREIAAELLEVPHQEGLDGCGCARCLGVRELQP